jgi:two-component sensor histidine kinase
VRGQRFKTLELTLEVKADEGVATADISVSLGLSVTELAINVLKHAFPKGRGGRVVVGYESHAPDYRRRSRSPGRLG